MLKFKFLKKNNMATAGAHLGQGQGQKRNKNLGQDILLCMQLQVWFGKKLFKNISRPKNT